MEKELLMKVKELRLQDYFNDKTKDKFEKDLYDGLKEHGFIILKQHTVDTSVLGKAYSLSKDFFDKSNDYKKQFISPSNMYQRGYIPYKVEKAKYAKVVDLKEFYQIGQEDNLYPSDEFQDTFSKLYSELEECSKVILKALTNSLNLKENYFDTMVDKGNHVLRLLHYPPIGEGESKDAIRAAEHEDINLITLLVASEGKGLQLKDKEGNWIDIETEKGDIVVDTGDMMARITNNHLPATTHRVINGDQKDQSRYSMPFFCHPKAETFLKVIKHFKDGNEDADVLAGDFLNERLEEIGLKNVRTN
jgi:isopenicillin N synthase-like dioxygenase